ncbi:MAG: helix-turn-helix domain-containing protein [Desulforudis sp.]|nr:MAG: helix-turn-helix domain-containing protein [Desulforudis sp.]
MPGLTPKEKRVIEFLSRSGPYPSYQTIAEQCSLSAAQVCTTIRELVRKGCLEVQTERRKGFAPKQFTVL